MSVAEPLVQAGLLGEAIDRAPDAVLVADESMHYLAVSQAACKLLGYTREELLALSVGDVADAPDSAATKRSGVTTLRRKDGNSVDAHYRAHETRLAGMTVYVATYWVD